LRTPGPQRSHLWPFAVLPVIVLNVGSLLIYGTYFAIASQRPMLVANIPLGQVMLVLNLFITLVEWALVLALVVRLRREGASVGELIARDGAPWRFRWGPAALAFLSFNLIFGVYMIWVWRAGPANVYEGVSLGARLVVITLVAASSAFCEELIWRGYLLTRLEGRGRGMWASVLLAALSFALIHGVFLPDRLLATFLIGVSNGYYYWRERKLVPLMVAHLCVNLWSFGLFLFAA